MTVGGCSEFSQLLALFQKTYCERQQRAAR